MVMVKALALYIAICLTGLAFWFWERYRAIRDRFRRR